MHMSREPGIRYWEIAGLGFWGGGRWEGRELDMMI